MAVGRAVKFLLHYDATGRIVGVGAAYGDAVDHIGPEPGEFAVAVGAEDLDESFRKRCTDPGKVTEVMADIVRAFRINGERKLERMPPTPPPEPVPEDHGGEGRPSPARRRR